MAKPRSELSAILNTIESNCYFQPSTNTTMKYPCIVYEINDVDIDRADNKPYITHDVYTITHIYKSPSSNLRNEILNAFDFISYNRQFKTDGLYHDVYTLYF